MTVKQFNIWLATHGYNQSNLAKALGINRQTITGYKNNGRFPKLFLLALQGIEYQRLLWSEKYGDESTPLLK